MKVTTITPNDLRLKLAEGAVKFQYTKKDGTTRTALGTLKPSLVTKKPRGGVNGAEGAGYNAYFDLDKNDWRNYHPDNLVGVVEG